MDFDQMLETWRAQSTAPPYDVNRDALRQALQTEEARVRGELRARRSGRWICWILGGAMAIWAVFWIAITITNGWPAIYGVTSTVSLGMFAFGVAAAWVSRGREPKRNFGNTLQEEVKRSLVYVDYQLSVKRREILLLLGTGSIGVATFLFTWTVNRSQDIPNSSFTGYGWSMAVMAGLFGFAAYKLHVEMRKAVPKLELRQRRLRELLAALEARE